MATKAKVIEVLKSNKALVRTVLSDGKYKAQKVNDEYVLLHETPAGWRQLADDQKSATNSTVIVLTDVKDLETEQMRTIAVNGDFVAWSTKTNFVFNVIKGKTSLELTQISDKQMKELLKADAK